MRGCFVALVLLAAARVHAEPSQPIAEAIAHQDVDMLRAQLPDPAAGCALAIVYAQRKDLPRAGLFLETCDDAQLPDHARELRTLKVALRDSELSELYVDTRPPGLVAEISSLPGEHVTTPATVWVPAGPTEVRATQDGITYTNSLTTKPHARATLFLDARPHETPPPKTGHADFSEQGDVGDQESGPPPDVKHGTIMPKKYVDGGTTSGAEQIADPFPDRGRRTNSLANDGVGSARELWGFSLGARAGAGVFHQATTGVRIGPAIGAVGRLRTGIDVPGTLGHMILEARADWSQRGGEMGHVDALGLTLGPSLLIVSTGEVQMFVGLGAKAELRLEGRLEDTLADLPVRRFGVDATGSFDLVPRTLPVMFGLRVEQGLTTLVPGLRDRALIVQLGVDWY